MASHIELLAEGWNDSEKNVDCDAVEELLDFFYSPSYTGFDALDALEDELDIYDLYGDLASPPSLYTTLEEGVSGSDSTSGYTSSRVAPPDSSFDETSIQAVIVALELILSSSESVQGEPPRTQSWANDPDLDETGVMEAEQWHDFEPEVCDRD